MQEEHRKIKEAVEDFFKRTGFPVQVTVGEPSDSTIPIDLKTDEPRFLIGEKGRTLIEIQNLLKNVLKKKITSQEVFYVDLDINNYKKKKAEYLKEIVRNMADEVVLTRMERPLPPMPAYERRIIHLELSGRENVITESEGEGLRRRVIIKPGH